MWRQLRNSGWRITSSWIDEAGEGETDDFSELWARISREIWRADALVLYAERLDFPLKGALSSQRFIKEFFPQFLTAGPSP